MADSTPPLPDDIGVPRVPPPNDPCRVDSAFFDYTACIASGGEPYSGPPQPLPPPPPSDDCGIPPPPDPRQWQNTIQYAANITNNITNNIIAQFGDAFTAAVNNIASVLQVIADRINNLITEIQTDIASVLRNIALQIALQTESEWTIANQLFADLGLPGLPPDPWSQPPPPPSILPPPPGTSPPPPGPPPPPPPGMTADCRDFSDLAYLDSDCAKDLIRRLLSGEAAELGQLVDIPDALAYLKANAAEVILPLLR